MKKKILRFYADKDFDIPKLIIRRPHYLMASQVEAAAVELYKQILKHEEIKDINISRRIYKIAETVLYKEFEQDHETLENAKEIISILKRENFLLIILTIDK